MDPRYGLLAITLALTFMISSCATYNAATGRRELMFISPEQETSIGRNLNQDIITKMRLSRDPEYNAWVRRVGEKIVHSIDTRGIEYKFRVVEDENMNAFTIPGGYVYATTGLLNGVSSDDELAAVLAHEIGHSEARHAVKHLEAAMGYNTVLMLAYILDSREEDKKKDQWAYIQAGGTAVFQLIDLGYSRKDEYEADRLSTVYMRDAGYDPRAILTLMRKLKEKERQGEPHWAYFLRSHPYLDERMEAVRSELAYGIDAPVFRRPE
ncbi:MAG: M48 family metallopeptidase [Candidatus Omnitrophica bacterium]|nr:M48 family metallopeptidase [Candidatus Omnitrophota bacterium]